MLQQPAPRGNFARHAHRLAQVALHLSRRGHVFRKRNVLGEEIAHSLRAMSAVLDGEIACLEQDGRSHFYKLLFRRDWPFFCAFELL